MAAIVPSKTPGTPTFLRVETSEGGWAGRVVQEGVRLSRLRCSLTKEGDESRFPNSLRPMCPKQIGGNALRAEVGRTEALVRVNLSKMKQATRPLLEEPNDASAAG